MTNYQGIQSDNSSLSLNGAEAFLNGIKKNQTAEGKKC